MQFGRYSEKTRVKAVFVLLAFLTLAGCKEPAAMPGVPLSISAESMTETGAAETHPAKSSKAETTPAESGPVVYVCGEVNTPGVYTLEAGARIHDAVEAAGGLTDAADPEFLNLAQRVADGEKINVLSREEAESAQTSAASASGGQDGSAVNINTASREELMTLPGIGEAKAEAILNYRETEGTFGSIEDIMLVSGIKEAAFAKIKDHITVG